MPDGNRNPETSSTCFDFSASRRRIAKPRLIIELYAYASSACALATWLWRACGLNCGGTRSVLIKHESRRRWIANPSVDSSQALARGGSTYPARTSAASNPWSRKTLRASAWASGFRGWSGTAQMARPNARVSNSGWDVEDASPKKIARKFDRFGSSRASSLARASVAAGVYLWMAALYGVNMMLPSGERVGSGNGAKDRMKCKRQWASSFPDNWIKWARLLRKMTASFIKSNVFWCVRKSIFRVPR